MAAEAMMDDFLVELVVREVALTRQQLELRAVDIRP
jgi:hypothetical protein